MRRLLTDPETRAGCIAWIVVLVGFIAIVIHQTLRNS